MRRIVGIFAHPDDEALGPSGTLATLAKENEVYLICVTPGEAAGQTAEEKKTIGAVRKDEMRHSAKILGIKEIFFLNYEDGKLCNELYHRLAHDLQMKIEELRPETLLTFEMRGVSGHIDHITVSLVTTFIFNKYSFIKKLMYYCISREKSDCMRDYFIYCPPGYTKDQVDEVVDVSQVWEIKLRAMKEHHSQKGDVERFLKDSTTLPKEEYFMLLEK